MGKTIAAMGGSTFAWFTRNPRGGRSNPPAPADVEALGEYASENRLGLLVAHASYTMNLCSSNKVTRDNGLEIVEYRTRNAYRLMACAAIMVPVCVLVCWVIGKRKKP